METRSELLRENKELNDRKELLELRQENRELKYDIKRLEAGKPVHGGLTSKQETLGIVLAVLFAVIVGTGILIIKP